jgi:excinuclease ABC subunit C
VSDAAHDNGFDAKAFVKNLTQRPGIYKMLDANGHILYIGKAKNLKKRVASYFRQQAASPKQQAMVAKILAIEVTVTHTEGEALLLESQLIKRHQPRYNINLRDDKSYPYVFLSSYHDFPQLSFHRGAKKRRGRYFGPYPSASAVKETLKLLQKIFPVRQCEDSYYNARSRPCLQHQIERCTAPCVGLVSKEQYQRDVDSSGVEVLSQKNELLLWQRLFEQHEPGAQLLVVGHLQQISSGIVFSAIKEPPF